MRKYNILKIVKKNDGFTLIEVMIAFVILIASFFIIENAFLQQKKFVFQVEGSINRSLAFSEIFQGLQANLLRYNKHDYDSESLIKCLQPDGGLRKELTKDMRKYFYEISRNGTSDNFSDLYNCFQMALSIKGLTSVMKCSDCSERVGMMIDPYYVGGKLIEGVYNVRILSIKKIKGATGVGTYKVGNYYKMILGG